MGPIEKNSHRRIDNVPEISLLHLNSDTIIEMREAFFAAILNGSLSNLPDKHVFALTGLIENSRLDHPSGRSSQETRKTLKQLLITGEYDEAFIELLHQASADKINNSIKKKKSVKKFIRKTRSLAFAIQGGIVIKEFINNEEIVYNIVAAIFGTLSLWEILDRATNDTVERIIIRSLIIREALERAYIPHNKRKNPDYEKIINTAIPGFFITDEFLIEVEKSHNDICFLLDTGYSVEELFKQFEKSPKNLFTVQPTAEVNNNFWKQLKTLQKRIHQFPIDQAAMTLKAKLASLVISQKMKFNDQNPLINAIDKTQKDEESQIKENKTKRQEFIRALIPSP